MSTKPRKRTRPPLIGREGIAQFEKRRKKAEIAIYILAKQENKEIIAAIIAGASCWCAVRLFWRSSQAQSGHKSTLYSTFYSAAARRHDNVLYRVRDQASKITPKFIVAEPQQCIQTCYSVEQV
jgi:hypothetical protein